MIGGVDSSFDRPNAAQARAAYAAGVRVWGGYFGSRDGLGLAVRWSPADFAVVKAAGIATMGFCSGWDNPTWIKNNATAYNVDLPCVDVETHIREDGPWVPGWVREAQSGLYGNLSIHYEPGQPPGRGANFNVMADYPGFDPQATWSGHLLVPPGPCGWQWRGTHSEFGLSVDRSWFDDTILPSGVGRGGAPLRQAGGGEGSMLIIVGADGRCHRFIVTDSGKPDEKGNRGGPVTWVAIPGGAGGFDGWSGGDGELPGGGGWIAAGSLAGWLDPSGGHERISLQGRGGNGVLYQKTVTTDTFEVAEEWHQVAGPQPAVPGAAPGAVADISGLVARDEFRAHQHHTGDTSPPV